MSAVFPGEENLKQIDKMRELYLQFNGDKTSVIEAYIAAETKGEVRRVSNKNGFSAEEYARRLFYNTYRRKSRLGSGES